MKHKKQVKSMHFSYSVMIFILGVLLGIVILLIIIASYQKNVKKQNAILFSPTSTPSLSVPTFISTKTLNSNQVATYTFYIQATSEKTNGKVISLQRTDTDKKFVVGIGTLVIIGFGSGDSQLQTVSRSNIFESPQGIVHLPNNASGMFRVISEGTGTITVRELSPK